MSYIGREPTPVPLSTADYQDGSVTGPKLAPGAAVANIGYTPLDEAGGTVSGNFDVLGTTDLAGTNVVGTLDVTGPIDLTGNFIQNPASGTFTLAQDPTLALQAATKQYVDNNFQLATGSVQALTGDLTLTAASARVFEFTAVPEFTIVNLPAANTLSISNGKFVFRNEGRFPFGLRDNAGNLIGAIGPNSTATVYLYDITTAAGKWSILGDDVRPFFITNSNVLPQSGTTVSDTLLSTQYALTVRLSATSYVVIHSDNTGTNQQVIAYAVDTSTRPATIGSRTVLAALSAASGVATNAPPCIAYAITSSTVYVANASSLTSHVILSVAGTSITVNNTLAGTFTLNPFQFNPVLGEITTVQRIDTDTFLFVNAPSAAAVSYQAVKIDGTVIRISAAQTSGTNATGMAGWVDMRLLSFNAGTGVGIVGVVHPTAAAAPFGLTFNRITVTKNAAGSAPTLGAGTLAASEILAVTGAAMAATFNFGFAADTADAQYGCVFYYANSTVFPTYNGIYNLVSGTLTSTAAQVVIATAGVATGFQRFNSTTAAGAGTASATTAGIIGNARGLLFDSYGAGAWRAYLITATSTRFIKISHVTTTYTATLADFAIPDGTNTVSGLSILAGTSSRMLNPTATGTGSAFAVLSNSAMVPAAGQGGGAKLYSMFETAGTNKINLADIYAPNTFSIRDSTPTLIGLQIIQTQTGYFALPVGDPTATTTNQGSFNQWAWFKMGTNGQLRSFGNWPLPIKNFGEVVFSSQFGIPDSLDFIYNTSNGIEFDQVEGIHYRRFMLIQTATVS
jgi:hypothetical protein